jgi:hypothetical protein
MSNKKKNMPKWDDYSIRSTAYYQKQGGIYSILLTILMNMRSTFRYRYINQPYMVLNYATFKCDCLIYGDGKLDEILANCSKEEKYTILILLLTNKHYDNKIWVIQYYQTLKSSGDRMFYQFDSLWSRIIEDENIDLPKDISLNNHSKTEKEILDNSLADEILALKANLQDAQKTIEEQQKTIQNLSNTTANSIDKYFTLEILIDYVRSRRHYHNSLQIINMIKDLLRGCNDKAIWDKVDAMEQEMLEKDQPHSIINNNNITGSNVITGLVNNPIFPIGVDPIEFIDSAIKEKLNSL